MRSEVESHVGAEGLDVRSSNALIVGLQNEVFIAVVELDHKQIGRSLIVIVILNGLDGAVFSCFCDFASRSLRIDSEAVSFELNETFMILLEDIVMHELLHSEGLGGQRSVVRSNGIVIWHFHRNDYKVG